MHGIHTPSTMMSNGSFQRCCCSLSVYLFHNSCDPVFFAYAPTDANRRTITRIGNNWQTSAEKLVRIGKNVCESVKMKCNTLVNEWRKNVGNRTTLRTDTQSEPITDRSYIYIYIGVRCRCCCWFCCCFCCGRCFISHHVCAMFVCERRCASVSERESVLACNGCDNMPFRVCAWQCAVYCIYEADTCAQAQHFIKRATNIFSSFQYGIKTRSVRLCASLWFFDGYTFIPYIYYTFINYINICTKFSVQQQMNINHWKINHILST